MVDFGTRLRRVLLDHGWVFLRPGKGDHEIWVHSRSGKKVSVDAGSKSRHLTNRILKSVGIDQKL